MIATTAAVLAAFALGQAQAQTAKAPQAPVKATIAETDQRAPQTDKTIEVTKGTRLTLTNFAGEVVVHAWDRSAVRIQARHTRTGQVDIRQTDGQITVSGPRRNRSLGSVDYEISAPSWLPVRLTGTYLFVSIDGLQSEIAAETVRGDLVVKGGAGSVTLKSVEGDVSLEGATGRIDARSVDGNVSVAKTSGEVVVETTDGAIRLTSMAAGSVDASTVDGDIVYDGTLGGSGQYRLTTHDGSIYVRLPENVGATVSFRTYEGRFDSTFPVQLPSNYRKGQRVTFTLGGGGAELDLEAFEGRIRLLKPSEPLPVERKRSR